MTQNKRINVSLAPWLEEELEKEMKEKGVRFKSSMIEQIVHQHYIKKQNPSKLTDM